MGLTSSEIVTFRREGWLGPFDLIDGATAARVLARIREDVLTVKSAIYAHTKGDLAAVDYKRDRHLDSPLMYRLAAAPAIVSRVQSLLGPDVLLWRSDMFEQGVGDPATSPHQDGAFEATRGEFPMIEAGDGETPVGHQKIPVEVDIPLTVSAWIALTPVRKATGALWVVPGTHTEVIPEVPGEGFAGMKYVPSRTFTPSDGRAIEIDAGQFILFHNLLVHGSYAIEHGRRFAWTTRYVAPCTRIHPRAAINAQGQDLANYGAVLVAGQDRLHRNPLRAAPAIGIGALVDERALG